MYGISGHLHILAFLKHLMMVLKYTFIRTSFLHLTKDTDSIKGHVAQILKSENIVKTMPLNSKKR